MKILIINPNSDEQTAVRMRKKAEDFVKGEYQVDVVSLKATPKLMKTHADAAAGVPEMIDIVKNGLEYDAFIVACHSDPNLDLIREITDKPVVGIAEASMHFAAMFGNGFAVISPSVKSISKKRALTRKYHCEELFITTEVSQSDDDEDLLQASKRAAEKNVDNIVLGCANYTNADRYIEKRLGLPVFDGVACALIIASGLVKYKAYKEE